MKKSYTTILLFTVLSLLGFTAFQKIPIQYTTDYNENRVSVRFEWANAAPEAIEKQVTARLEGVLSTLQNIKKIESFSEHHKGVVTITMDGDVDADKFRFEVVAAIRQVYKYLPVGVSYPIVTLDDPESTEYTKPLVSLQFSGNLPPGALKDYIDKTFRLILAQLPGVQSIEINGGEPEEWLLEYNPLSFQTLGLNEEKLTSAIDLNRKTTNLGWIKNKFNGLKQGVTIVPYKDTIDLSSIPIKKHGEKILRLGEVVNISKHESVASSYFRINGSAAIQIQIFAKADADQFLLTEQIKQQVNNISAHLPLGASLRTELSAADASRNNIRILSEQALLSIVCLVSLTIILFRSLKATFLIICSALSNLLITSLAFFILNIELHIQSLATLVLSIGLLFGNILLTFNSYRKYRNREIIYSLLTATLIASTAISVIWLLPQESNTDFLSFGKTLLIGLWVSIFVCYWLVPALTEQLKLNIPKTHYIDITTVDKIYSYYLHLISRFHGVAVTASILVFGLPIFLIPQKFEEEAGLYGTYNAIMNDPWVADNIRPYMEKGLGGFLRLFAQYVSENSNYTSDEQTVLSIDVGMPSNTPVEQMDSALRKIETELSRYKELDRYISHVFNGQRGSIDIYFKKPFDEGFFPYALKARVIALTTEMSGIDWHINGVGEGFNFNVNGNDISSFNIILKGYNYNELEKISINLGEKVSQQPRVQKVDINQVPGLFSQNDLYQYKIFLNEAYWARNGISVHQLYSALKAYDVHSTPDFYTIVGDNYQGINIKPTSDKPFDINFLNSEPLRFNDSLNLKIYGNTQIGKGKVIPGIHKENQQYIRQVSFDYMGSFKFGEKFLNKTLRNFRYELPLGYSIESMPYMWWRFSQRSPYEFILLSLFIIFIISSVMFESLRQPFTLIASIALSFVGSFIAFFYLDVGFDQGGFTSFILITGISSLPFVLVINEYNNQKKINPDFSSINNYILALKKMLRPIMYVLLCSLCSLISILSIAPDQSFWDSLAVGTLGGIIASAIVIVLFVPIFLLARTESSQSSRGVI